MKKAEIGMNKNIAKTDTTPESILFSNVVQIIEKRKINIVSTANNQIVLMFWQIGKYINSAILGLERAEYGKRIVKTLCSQLQQKYGNEYYERNIRWMRQFAEQFPDFEIVSILSTQLSWSHIRELLPLKTMEEKLYYAFTFVARQRRIPIDDDDYKIDLLFFNRDLRRLVAVDLKVGKFKPSYKGQMELYLNRFNKYDRREGEEAPIGLILCTDANRKVAELMELDKSGIAVAEYWTKLPPKEQFESKNQEIMAEAKERIERRKLLGASTVQKQITYFLEESNDETDDKD